MFLVSLEVGTLPPGGSYKQSFYLPYKEKKDKQKREGMEVAIIVVLASWKWGVAPIIDSKKVWSYLSLFRGIS
jgi:hypothetical protein